MYAKKDKIMFCKEGKCVDVQTIKCNKAFEDINNQIACELLQKHI